MCGLNLELARLVLATQHRQREVAHLLVQPVQRRHVAVLDHQDEIPVLAPDRVGGQHPVGEHQLLLLRLVEHLAPGVVEAAQIIFLEAGLGPDQAEAPDGALGVGKWLGYVCARRQRERNQQDRRNALHVFPSRIAASP